MLYVVCVFMVKEFQSLVKIQFVLSTVLKLNHYTSVIKT